MKKKTDEKNQSSGKRHIPVDDEKLQEVYEDALGDILENDDENARDNLADYMDELKEESKNVGRPSELSSTQK